jgi:hypothetical protein
MRHVRSLFVFTLLLIAASPRLIASEFDWTCNSAEYGTSQCLETQPTEDADGTSGGKYGQCSAYSSHAQMCTASVTDNVTHQVSCAYVTYSASCYCDEVTKQPSGTCRYY